MMRMISGIARGIVTKPSLARRFQVISSETCGHNFLRTSSCRFRIAFALGAIDLVQLGSAPGLDPGAFANLTRHVSTGFSGADEVWIFEYLQVITMIGICSIFVANSTDKPTLIRCH